MSKIVKSVVTIATFASASHGAASAADVLNRSAPRAPAPVPNPFFVAFEGGAAFSDFSRQAALTDAKLGSSPSRDLGAYGSISIGRKIEGTSYDWRISAAATKFMKNETSSVYSYEYDPGEYTGGFFNQSNRAGFQAADLDFGRSISSGLLEARIFAGVRALHESSSSTADISSYGVYGYGVGLNHRYLGFGPRIGADVRYGADLGIVANVSVAALYGRHDEKTSIASQYFGYSFGISQADSRYDWVTDVAGSIGASWRPSATTEFVAGYRGEKLINIGSAQQKSQSSHGPFVRAQIKY